MPKKDSLIVRQKSTLRNEKAKRKAAEKYLSEIRNKNTMNRPTALCKILLVKRSVSKEQIKKQYHKMRLLTYPDAGGDKVFVKTINRAYQIPTNDAARAAHIIFGLDEAEKVMNNEN